MGKLKQKQFLVGFALETEDETSHAIQKIKSKNLTIVLNSLNDTGAGFSVDSNKVTYIDKNETITPFELKSKILVAKDIFSQILTRMNKILSLLLLSFSLIKVYGQELNAQFVVNADLVNQTNQQIFETLERSLNEFINSQSWSSQDFFLKKKSLVVLYSICRVTMHLNLKEPYKSNLKEPFLILITIVLF